MQLWEMAVQSIRTHLSASLGYLLSVIFVVPAAAATQKLGVVYSSDNANHWPQIAERLRATGIDYCVVTASRWQQIGDLQNLSVLFLPNVSTLSREQAQSLEAWMKRGGNVVVSGPTGNLSQPEVRSQLRSLFGAYWGFPITSATPLKPDASQGWTNQPNLAATFRGGVVLPATLQSRTAAVWLSEGKPPAVVTTEKTTFLGWRWGVDEVVGSVVDLAWLQASLKRYGPLPTGFRETPLTCDTQTPLTVADIPDERNRAEVPAPPPLLARGSNPPTPARQTSAPAPTTPPVKPFPPAAPPAPAPAVLPDDPAEISPALIEATGLRESQTPHRRGMTPLSEWENSQYGSRRGPISPNLANQMIRELEALIARVESALVSAEAVSEIAKADKVATRELEATVGVIAVNASQDNSRQAIADARAKLETFRQLVAARNYDQAHQQWRQAHRLVWEHYPTDRQLLVQPEIRAIWLDRGTIVQAKSAADLAKLFDRLAAAGINTVFFETVNAGYPIFPSQVAPQQNPLVKGWDPLEAAVTLAHERNMELHAWVWVFAAANHRHNQLLGLPSDYLGPVLSAHPDWVMTDIAGRKFDSGSSRKAFLDPANPEVRRYLLSLLSEISTRYQVDGIHFDYIRYPFQDPRINRTYGYSATSRRLFQEQHGVDPQTLRAGDRLWSTWTEFRTQQVDEFMEITTRALKAQRPNLVISAAVFPFQRPARLLRLQQNWERWAEQGWVDWLVPMTYAQSSSDLQNLTRPLFYEQYLLDSTLLLPGIRLLNLPEAVAVDQMQFLRHLPVEGYALFAAENLSPQFQQVFGRTQGTNSNSAIPLPHRRPFQAALVRYQSLEKEWIFLLASGQIAISGSDRQAWLQGSEELTAALQQLATNPSNRNYLKADLALSRFQQGFNRWFQGQAQQNPYQVAGWVNRLTTLDRLLNYGERRILRENSTAPGANSR